MNTPDIESDESSTPSTMKQRCEELQDRTERTCRAEGRNNCQNCHLSDYHKMIDLEEGSPTEEDSLGEEDSPEEEDSQEEGDTQAEEEAHLEDRQEEAGDCHRYLCSKPNKGNW